MYIQILKAITKHNEIVIGYDTYGIILFCNETLSVGVFLCMNFPFVGEVLISLLCVPWQHFIPSETHDVRSCSPVA